MLETSQTLPKDRCPCKTIALRDMQTTWLASSTCLVILKVFLYDGQVHRSAESAGQDVGKARQLVETLQHHGRRKRSAVTVNSKAALWQLRVAQEMASPAKSAKQRLAKWTRRMMLAQVRTCS